MARKAVRRRKGQFKPAGKRTRAGLLIADPMARKSQITVIAYGNGEIEEKRLSHPDQIRNYLGRPVVWVNVAGLGDIATIEAVAGIFGLHGLALEDVVNTHQRAKVDEYPEQDYIVVESVLLEDVLHTEQVSIFLGKGYLLTFEEGHATCLEPVRERLLNEGGRLASRGPDFLLYAIVDAVIDSYFPVLEEYGERLDRLEDLITIRPEYQAVSDLHMAKRDLLRLRRAIWPHREAIHGLVRDQSPLLEEETRVYLRDCYDHAVRIIDLVETYRELASDLMDLYLSSVNKHMNEVMKTLTIFATIFMPLSFITGLYGMNFKVFPELGWTYGYPFAWLLCILTTIAIYLWVSRKGWMRPYDIPAEPPD